MTPLVSIIMGSTSDLPILEKAASFLDSMEIPFEMNALSAHRTPREVEEFARNAGYRQLYLETHTNLEAAIRLYEKLGFKNLQEMQPAEG